MANIENMKLTLALLERVKAEQKPFSLGVWKAFPENLATSSKIKIFGSAHPAPECGFVACVGGWMMSDPEHQNRGMGESSWGEPRYYTSYGYSAIAHFWEVQPDQAAYIGDEDRYVNPDGPATIDDAMGRLRELIALYSPKHETA